MQSSLHTHSLDTYCFKIPQFKAFSDTKHSTLESKMAADS